jgi:hypothetical protein
MRRNRLNDGCVREVLLAVACFVTISVQAEMIHPDKRVDWVPGVTVGVRGGIPARPYIVNVTTAPYNADKTGVNDATSAIQAAINNAPANSVVFLPAGLYKIGGANTLVIDRSDITLRGAGTNTIILGLTSASRVLKVGHDPQSGDQYRTYQATNGFTKGSTNLMLKNIKNGYGDTIKAGDALVISMSTRNIGSPEFPVISVANYNGIIKQLVVVASRNGNMITLTSPLVWNFTNATGVTWLSEVDTVKQPRRRVGVEDLAITLTHNGAKGSASFIVDATCLVDSWFSNVDLGFANNYQIYLTYSAHCEVRDSSIHDALSSGTSHAGLIMAHVTGCLIENNIFARSLFPAIEFNEGVMGCVGAYNFFTGNSLDIDCHNSHPMMNLWEGNVIGSFFKMDGYFGSASHQTLFRNHSPNTIAFKRWTSHMQVVGNVVGRTGTDFVMSREQSGYGSPYPIFEMGYPNIGNNDFVGKTPEVPWNHPGTNYQHHSMGNLRNGFPITKNQTDTNILWGDFRGVPGPTASIYPVVFRDQNDQYWGAASGALLTVSAGTSSNLVLSSKVSVSNGWTLYVAGQAAYQQLQMQDKHTHNFHGNYVYTNATGSVIWDPANPDRNIPASLLYTSAPAWWGTNRWPAIGPDVSPVAGLIPAKARHMGIPVGTPSKPLPPTALRIVPD